MILIRWLEQCKWGHWEFNDALSSSSPLTLRPTEPIENEQISLFPQEQCLSSQLRTHWNMKGQIKEEEEGDDKEKEDDEKEEEDDDHNKDEADGRASIWCLCMPISPRNLRKKNGC